MWNELPGGIWEEPPSPPLNVCVTSFRAMPPPPAPPCLLWRSLTPSRAYHRADLLLPSAATAEKANVRAVPQTRERPHPSSRDLCGGPRGWGQFSPAKRLSQGREVALKFLCLVPAYEEVAVKPRKHRLDSVGSLPRDA